MLKQCWLPFASAILTAIIGMFAARPIAAQVHSQAELAGRLRETAAQVHSMSCRYTQTRHATAEEMIPLIKEVCRGRGEESDFASFVIQPESAAAFAEEIQWHRKGAKERALIRRIKSGEERLIAYDGETVRKLTSTPGEKPTGTVETADYSWDSVELHPFAVLFEYVHGKPYWRIVEGATDFRAAPLELDNGTSGTEVFVRRDPTTAFVLRFDENDRLIERDLVLRRMGQGERVWERHRLSGYREYVLADGHTIAYPSAVSVSRYMGRSTDGRLVEWVKDDYEFRDIEFNPKLDDSLFMFSFADDSRVFDRVNERGWIQGDQLEKPWPPGPPSPLSAWLLYGALPLGIIAVIGLLFYWRARKSRRESGQ